jgi:hypothetical protein
MAQQFLVDKCLLIIYSSRLQSVRCMPDKTRHLQETDIHSPPVFEPAVPAS